MKFYILEYRYADLERRAEVRPRHLEYLNELNTQGKLAMAGPLADGTGAIVVYRAADVAEAQGLVANDPYTAGAVTTDSTLREWNVVITADPAAPAH